MANRAKRGGLIRRGGWWCLRYQQGGKQVWRALHTRDKQKAEAERKRLMDAVALPDTAATRRSLIHLYNDARDDAVAEREKHRKKLTVIGTWQAYVDDPGRRQCSPRTRRHYASDWGRFVAWVADERPELVHLEDCTEDDAKAFAGVVDKDPRRGFNSYNKIIATCRRVWKCLLPKRPNPFAVIAAKPPSTVSYRNFTAPELREIFERATGELRVLLGLGFYAGLRLSDSAQLPWRDVDMAHRTLTVVPQKTRARTRRVVRLLLHPTLHEMLRGLPDKSGEYVLPVAAAKYLSDASAVSRNLTAFLGETCAIKTIERGHKIVGFSSLRHSFASLAAEGGAAQATLQALLGHGSPALQRTYVTIGDTAINQAINALPDVTADQRPPLPTAMAMTDAKKLAAIAALVSGRKDKLAVAIRVVLEG